VTKLTWLEPGHPASDYSCPACGFRYQLKSQKILFNRNEAKRQVLKRRIQNLGVLCVLAVKFPACFSPEIGR